MTKTKINYTYKPMNSSDSESETEPKRIRRGIKETFTDSNNNNNDNNYQNERKLQVNSVYPDLDPNVNLNSTTLDDLDLIEENKVINTENIYVDPFKPLFLPTFNKDEYKDKPNTKNKKIIISDFLSEIANSYVNILDDLISGNYEDVSELLLKGNRGIATGLLLIIISIFFIFFNNVTEF